MSFDMNNDYSAAGPGANRRVKRLTLDTIPKRVAQTKPKPEYRRNQKPAQEENPIKVTAKGVKHRVTLLTLQHGFDICDRLRNEGFGDLTKVLISHQRDVVRQVLRVMLDKNLITQKYIPSTILACRSPYYRCSPACPGAIRRFLMHVLPKGVHRIRHYGLFANGHRAANIARARELLAGPPRVPPHETDGPAEPEQLRVLPKPCPCCGGRMIIIETFARGCQHRPTPAPPIIRIDTS
jgi:hypothetical protein